MARLSGRPLLDTAADAALFVGRRPELERLGRALAERLNVLVPGPLGSGRTSLVRHQRYRMRQGEGSRLGFLDATSLTEPAAFLRAVGGVLGREVDAATPPAGVLALLAEADGLAPGALAVDGLSPAVAQVVFGQLRDEVWQLPLTWVVTCAERDEAAFLRPPADAFFDTTLRVGPMDEPDLRDLLRRRADPDELDDDAVAEAAALAGGNPRRAIDLARHLLLRGGDGDASGTQVRDRLVDREAAVERLGTPARMLLAELEVNGGASASDEGLLERLGWTRARAAQVLGELERAGLVQAADEPRPVGRPRRVYRATDWLTA
jgi:hypothetical protein